MAENLPETAFQRKTEVKFRESNQSTQKRFQAVAHCDNVKK